jgi:predicted RNA-binding Zn ribbon-like protein
MRYDGISAAPSPFVGERLWLDFVNTDTRDVLDDFPAFIAWLETAGALETDRASGILRRAEQQPAGAAAVLADARRVRAALRNLAERGATVERARVDALTEINRVLGRSAGMRRIDLRPDGRCTRTFAPVGDAFAGLMIPVVDSAADSMVTAELPRIRRCVGARCTRVFYDATKNGCRRWCDMSTCGNRAKAARHRARHRTTPPGPMPPLLVTPSASPPAPHA